MVKTDLDAFCVKSGILCRKCQEKIEKGQITDLDLKIIRSLSEFEKNFPILQDVQYYRSVESGDTLAVLVNKRDVSKMLSTGGKIVKALAEEFGMKVKVLGHGGDARQFLEDLFSPFSILAINTVWIPDGTTETKVILTGHPPKRMPVDFEVVKKLAHELQGMTLRIEFERP